MHCKAEGGIGIEYFRQISLTLKMRWFGQLLSSNPPIWVALAKANIGRSLNNGLRRKSRRFWTPTEVLLLDGKLHIVGRDFL